MGRQRSWTDEALINAVAISKSYRNVLILLRLVPAGGNYEQVKTAIKRLGLATDHFTGMGWSTGLKFNLRSATPIQELLVANGTMQSYSLKKRLFRAGLKSPACEMCGWARKSLDGRIPVELDHINGNHFDNRIENLRILCPNCHSLQPTHRGKNKRHLLVSAGVVTGSQD
jgi:hypothetical protein